MRDFIQIIKYTFRILKTFGEQKKS